MKEEIKALVQYRIAQAKEAFKDGMTLFPKGSYRGALNRFYYAAFYAARALLATKGVDSSKHSGVISLFQRCFVKNGLFKVDLSKILPHAFEERLESDYHDFTMVSKELVEFIKNEVAKFVDECDRVLNQIIGEGGTNETRK